MFRSPVACRAERALTLALEVLLNSRVWPEWLDIEPEKAEDAVFEPRPKTSIKFSGMWTSLTKARVTVTAVIHLEKITDSCWIVRDSTIEVDDRIYAVSWGTQFNQTYAGSSGSPHQFGSQGYGVALTLAGEAESKVGFGPAETWMQPVSKDQSSANAA